MPTAYGSRFAAQRAELMKRVSRIGFFQKLSGDEQRELIDYGKFSSFNDGEEIFDEGAKSNHSMYFVVTGNVEIQLSGYQADDGTSTVATMEPGDLFGEIAVLDNMPRSASARAKGPITILGLELFPSDPNLPPPPPELTIKILKHIGEGLCRKLRDTNKILLHARS